jgi:alkylation response protein AidB-like acyl-CoA dehydrogenase
MHLTGEQILDNARSLGPQIEASVDRIEDERRLPDELVTAMRHAGVFRVAVPAAWGGPDMDLVSQSKLIEILAYHDASVAWIAMICSDSGHYAARLDEATARELYPELDMLTAGFLYPVGQAVEVEGGYRVSGRWQFGSGCLHADRIVAGCLVHDSAGLKTGAGGFPEVRAVWLPREAVTIHYTWHTTGLAGSGSNDYSVSDVFVPARHSFHPFQVGERPEPLYRYHGLFFVNLPAVSIGCAQRMLDDLRLLATTKITMPARTAMKDEYRVQIALAEGSATIAAARAYQDQVLGDLWATLCAGKQPTREQRAAISMMSVHAIRAGLEVGELVCEAVGGAAIFSSNPFDRRRRDLATVTAHIIGQRKTLAAAAQLLFGEEPAFSFV